ncbi:MAG: lysine exporter LysO family protein [Eubacteriales bacterium]
MSKIIFTLVTAGMLAGHFIIPKVWIDNYSNYVIVVGLTLLLFFVGIDIGKAGTLLDNIKKSGLKMILFPMGSIAGTLVFSILSGVIFPSMSIKDCLCISAGFGWYTLAPSLLLRYSTEIAAISFLHNVMREMIGLLLIPIVAKKIGYIEAASLTGAAAMDVCLPVIEKATSSTGAVYAFIMGLAMSTLVPYLVPIMMSL